MKRSVIIGGTVVFVVLVIVFWAFWRGGVFLPPPETTSRSVCVNSSQLEPSHVEFAPGPNVSYDARSFESRCRPLVTLCSGVPVELTIQDAGTVVASNTSKNRSVLRLDDLPVGIYDVTCDMGGYRGQASIERLETPDDLLNRTYSIVSDDDRDRQ